MSQYPQRAGKRFEKELLDYFRRYGYDAERLRQTGKHDEGDLAIRTSPLRTERHIVIEAKRCKAMDLAGWIKEAQIEHENYRRHRAYNVTPTSFVVIHHARGKPISEAYVTTTLREWLEFL